LRGRFVRYPSVSLSPTLSRNEKVEQHIRKKTHKPNALRFWVEGGVISLYGFDSVFILVRSPDFAPSNYPTESLPDGGFREACPVYTLLFKCVNDGTRSDGRL